MPTGSSRGDKNPWDASRRMQWCFSKLSSDTSLEAENALLELRNMHVDDYTYVIKSSIADQRRIRLEENFVSPSLKSLQAALENELPQSAADVQSIVLDELTVLQSRLRGDALNLVNNFYNDAGVPRIENECRDQMLIALGKLPYGIQYSPETAAPQGKRSDVAFTYNDVSIPLEAKGQWHKDVWESASAQLDKLYAIDHKAFSKGIFVVFWFGAGQKAGKRLKLPPEGIAKPESAEEMQKSLESLLPSSRRSDIAIVVLDLIK